VATFGFVVNDIVGDGASENRTTFKTLATVTTGDVLKKNGFTAEQLKGLPLNFKVAFRHPNKHYKDVLIFIGGEMPHWVKKFRNALDNKKRKLTFRGKSFNLEMLKAMWEAMGDSDISSGRLREYKFTVEHFTLNSYNKMRVFLAVQIASLTMIRMVEDYCKPESEGGRGGDIEQYRPMLDIFHKVNRLVDIMNAKPMNRGVHLNVEKINSPKHIHLTELLDILRIFTAWKKECKSANNFIT
jgi:hypothetical protein